MSGRIAPGCMIEAMECALADCVATAADAQQSVCLVSRSTIRGVTGQRYLPRGDATCNGQHGQLIPAIQKGLDGIPSCFYSTRLHYTDGGERIQATRDVGVKGKTGEG